MTIPAAPARGGPLTWWAGIACLGAGAFLGQLVAHGDAPAPVPSPVSEPELRPERPREVAMPSLAPIVERVKGGVVSVRSVLHPEADGQDSDASGEGKGVVNGTGFVIHEGGLVVTNRHLTVGAMNMVVEIPGAGVRTAELVGEDSFADLAVLRIVDPPGDLTVLALGRSEDLLQGDWVVTVGNPFGFTQTVTPGIVSYVGRHLPRHDMRATNAYLQFSAPVNPGHSGGPVFDMDGRVVGVTTRSSTAGQGIAFAIPSRAVRWVLRQLEGSPDGRVHRGYMGISFSSLGRRDRGEGVMIVEVEEDQPAARAGLRAGDVVVRYDGAPVRDAATLHEAVTTSPPGEQVEVVVRRQQDEVPVDVVLGEMGGGEPAEVGGTSH